MDQLKELKAAKDTQTPPPKRPAPSPATSTRAKAKSKTSKAAPPPPPTPNPPPSDGPEEDLEEEEAEEDREVEPEEEPPQKPGKAMAKAKAKGGGKGEDVPFSELSEAAKDHRLRRMCEQKPSGKIHVPQPVHDAWMKGGDERRLLREMLEQSNGEKECQRMFSCVVSVRCVFSVFLVSQDAFVSTFTRQHEKVSKFRKIKRRQWHTRETMKTKLNWSAPRVCLCALVTRL